jgi:hypothetical protein
MRKTAIALVLALSAAASTSAIAQEGTVSGAAGGAVTGAIVGGPVGAAVGGVAGAAMGTIMAPPKQVRQYVVQDQRPSIAYEGEVVVGERLPRTVEVYRVPESDYSYTIVNNKRYIVDSDHKVIEMVE